MPHKPSKANNDPILVPLLRKIKGGFSRFAPLWISESTERAYYRLRNADHQLASIETASAAIGDLLTWSGDRIVRIGVGSNGHVLTADSTVSGGIKWSAASGGGGGTDTTIRDTLRTARVFYWIARTGGTQIIGPNGLNIIGQGSSSNTLDSLGGFSERRPSGTGINQIGRWHRANATADRETQAQLSPSLTARIRTAPDLTNGLYFLGLTNGQLSNAADGGGSKQFIAFRYLYGTDTYWTAVTHDGTTLSTSATTTTVAADTVYELSIDHDHSSGTCTFSVNSTDTTTINTNLPGASERLGIDFTAINNGDRSAIGVGLRIGLSTCYLATK